MIDMSSQEDVKALKANMHFVFDTPQGKEIMDFLEATCSWYHSVFVPSSPDLTLINDGKRQVLATIKTVLACSPEQISTIAAQQ